MLFRQNSCRKSQKGLKMAEKKTQKGADTLTFTYCQKKQNKA
jgi:hypothetical protein